MRRFNVNATARWGVTTLILMLSAAAGQAQDAPALAISKANRTVAITATEQVKHMAELGIAHIGFVQYGPTREAAYNSGTAISNAIVQALLRAGVAREAIQSESQELAETPMYDSQPGPTTEERRARAFHLRQSWTVRVAADDAARALDAAVKAGANESGEIDWALRDPNAAQAEAGAKAMQRAQMQARAMASGLGVHLGDLLYASNQVEGRPVLPAPGRMASLQMAAPAPAPPPLAINPREIETSATVYAVFALE